MLELIAIGVFLVWMVIASIRELRRKEFLAKLMDCEYIQIGTGEYFIPTGKIGE